MTLRHGGFTVFLIDLLHKVGYLLTSGLREYPGTTAFGLTILGYLFGALAVFGTIKTIHLVLTHDKVVATQGEQQANFSLKSWRGYSIISAGLAFLPFATRDFILWDSTAVTLWAGVLMLAMGLIIVVLGINRLPQLGEQVVDD